MTVKIFLDDIRDPPDDTWTVARSYEQAIKVVQRHGFPDIVSFDHDLGEGLSGMDFAHWLVAFDLDHNGMPDKFTFQVHSANPVGRDNIVGLLDQYIRWRSS